MRPAVTSVTCSIAAIARWVAPGLRDTAAIRPHWARDTPVLCMFWSNCCQSWRAMIVSLRPIARLRVPASTVVDPAVVFNPVPLLPVADNTRSDTLDDDRRRHAAGGAHGDQAALQVTALQLVEHGADQDRASRADRMAERDRAAVDVDLVAVDLQIADELFDDDCECLIDFPQVDVVHRQIGRAHV